MLDQSIMNLRNKIFVSFARNSMDSKELKCTIVKFKSSADVAAFSHSHDPAGLLGRLDTFYARKHIRHLARRIIVPENNSWPRMQYRSHHLPVCFQTMREIP